MNKLNVEYMGIETLIPYINNPRKNDKAIDIVAESIQEFGFKNPIIVDKDNIIVAGHTRYEASKKLDLKEVPVIKQMIYLKDKSKHLELLIIKLLNMLNGIWTYWRLN